MFQRDYVLRMIEAATQAIGRALRLLVQKRPEEAEQELAEAYSALSVDRELLLLLDGPSARNLLGSQDRLAMAVRLLICDCEVKCHKHDTKAAARRLRAARRLLAEHTNPELGQELSQELERVAQLLNGSTDT